jgi:uridine phosphorylase
MSQFPASELVLNNLNQVYHLGLSPENIAPKIILVGDQNRVQMISNFFESIDHKSQHREFVCHTGHYHGKRISVISTGIGTDNIDITVNEIDALFNIDLEKKIEKTDKTSLQIIRIGTCGILQPDIPIHSYILSSYALGLDNIPHFYQISFNDTELKLLHEICSQLNLPKSISPYLVASASNLNNKLESEKTYEGITVTSSGFYGPQGRQLRIPNAIAEMNEKLTGLRTENEKVLNFEMESSALFALGRTLGHACTTICLGIANRPNMEFSKGYEHEMNELIEYVLERI